MSAQYDFYLRKHIGYVSEGLSWMQTHIPDIFTDPQLAGVNLELQFAEHDRSKYDAEEYDAYDRYFYGGNKSYQVTQDFNRAWLHHIHHNPHHWQYWVLLEDDPKDGKPILIEMPLNYILEMVCDWWTFSWSEGDRYEIFDWWNEHKDTMQLNPKTREKVIDILDRIAKALDAENAAAENEEN